MYLESLETTFNRFHLVKVGRVKEESPLGNRLFPGTAPDFGKVIRDKVIHSQRGAISVIVEVCDSEGGPGKDLVQVNSNNLPRGVELIAHVVGS